MSSRLTGALLLAAAALPGLADNQVLKLGYGLRPATSYGHSITLDMKTEVDLGGLSAEQAEALAVLLGHELEQDLEVIGSLRTGTARDDGSLPFEYGTSEVRSRLVVGGQTIEVPESELPAGRLGGRLLPGGLSVEVDRGSGGDGPAPAAGPRDLLVLALPRLPAGGLRPGDRLETEHGFRVLLPTPDEDQLEVAGRTTFALRDFDDRRARFDVRMDLGQKGAAAAVRIAGGGSGAAVFDLEEGIFAEVHVDLELTLVVSNPGLRLHLRGPLDVRLSRVAPAR